MKLTLKDRISLSSLYPQKGSMVDQIMVRDIAEKVKITQKEVKAYDIKSVQRGTISSTTWNPKKAKGKDIEFTPAELEFLRKRVEELDNKKEITVELVDLCLKLKEKN